MTAIALSIVACIGALLLLLSMLRMTRLSLGIPFAYLFLLELIHVPGALAHLASDGVLTDPELTQLGIEYAAAGCCCFVAGVALARYRRPRQLPPQAADRTSFSLFCLAESVGIIRSGPVP